jgi:hypothetical protein
MNALIVRSYKIRFLTLGGEMWVAKAWASASTYEDNIKTFRGLELKSKKGSIMETPLHSKTRRG